MMVSVRGRLSSIETNRGKSRECAGGDGSFLATLEMVKGSRVERDKSEQTQNMTEGKRQWGFLNEELNPARR